MAMVRSHLVHPDAPGFHHCISRCVRGGVVAILTAARLAYTGGSRSTSLLELAELFAVGVYAHAVMSEHVHVVVRIDPIAAAT